MPRFPRPVFDSWLVEGLVRTLWRGGKGRGGGSGGGKEGGGGSKGGLGGGNVCKGEGGGTDVNTARSERFAVDKAHWRSRQDGSWGEGGGNGSGK